MGEGSERVGGCDMEMGRIQEEQFSLSYLFYGCPLWHLAEGYKKACLPYQEIDMFPLRYVSTEH